MRTHIALIIILSLFLGSCVTQRKCALKFPLQSSRDSVYVETIKEVPVLIPGDSILIDVPIDCPDQNLIKFENAKLKQEISIIKGKLISKVQIKSDTVFVPVVETKTIVKEVKVPDPVKFTPKFYKYCTLGFWGFILAGLIFLYIKYKVKILSLLK